MIKACRCIVLGEKHKGNKQFPAAFTSIYERFNGNSSFWYKNEQTTTVIVKRHISVGLTATNFDICIDYS